MYERLCRACERSNEEVGTLYWFMFFFSSRRRHTRYIGDWSSDVCSSDLIVDVTAMDVMDSFASRTLREIAHMIRLRGAETVIVGIQPEVAFAMVQLGLTLEDVATALDLEEGLAYLIEKFKNID